MATLRQIEAARRNGAKSRGPKTPEGKAKSSKNALKHGLRSDKTYVLRNETPDKWRDLLDVCVEKFQPADSFELELVAEIAHTRWRMRRFWIIENALLDAKMDDQAPGLARDYQHIDEEMRLGKAFAGLADGQRAIHLLPRYEAHVRRHFDRALANLAAVRRNGERTEEEPHEPAGTRPASGQTIQQLAPPSSGNTTSHRPDTELPNEPYSAHPEAA